MRTHVPTNAGEERSSRPVGDKTLFGFLEIRAINVLRHSRNMSNDMPSLKAE